MQSNKTSKKTSKVAEKLAAPVKETTMTDSKPAKRTTKSSPAASNPITANTSAPKTVSHRHSKANVPATPVVEEVVVDVVVAAPPVPVSHEEVARLAYTYWEERNYAHGNPEEDWHRAVKALSAAS